MKKNRKLIIVMSIVLALIVAIAVFAYLFMATDMFKSSKVLFAKYISQNSEPIQKILDLETIEVYGSLKDKNKYESNTNAKMVHSEGGEISNPLNNLTAKLDIQKDNDEQYVYVDGKILYKEEQELEDGQTLYEDKEYLEAEMIREQDVYGIRFTDAVKQFITVKKNENTENVANDIGIDETQLETSINIINGSEEIISKEQLITLKDKYLNIIIQEFMNGTFEKQKNAMITYNNVTTETNAYSVLLSGEQVADVLLQILNNVKTETEILDILQLVIDKEEIINQIDETINKINEELEMPTVKVTVYEQKQKTIRTDIEIGLYKISIENTEQDEEVKTKISYLDLNSDQVMQYDLEISKKNINNQENLEIVVNAIEGEENYTITISNEMQSSDNKITFNSQISHKQDITTTSFILENSVEIGKDFEKKQSLALGNNILISSIEGKKRQELIELLKKIVPQKTNERVDLLKEKLGLKQDEAENEETENNEQESEMSQIEINKFNAKFEFYAGNEITAENVKTLLDIVKSNLASYEILQEDVDNANATQNKEIIKLNIEKEVVNEEAINQVLQKINNKKYKVSISYKEDNGLIDYIEIIEI